jgi:voltage-dependent anion channel protein 2
MPRLFSFAFKSLIALH